ncbi:MAG TPA: hypothetical protein PLO67_22630 [Saprospiraceae bacterium]|nr:hypothetical protein [Saprospiraceae bacterium]
MNHSSFLPTPPKDPPEDVRTFAFRQLLQRIQEIAPLDECDRALLEQKIRWEICPKGTLLLRPGEVSNHLRFMHEGAVICYEHVDEELQLEKVGWIARPSELVLEINSFFQRSPTLQYLKCTAPCAFLTLTYDDLQMLYVESPAWNTAGRRLFEEYMLLMAERTYLHQLNTAKEKYKYFTERFPEATQLFSLRHIAAFLRIRPETLSRLRSPKSGSSPKSSVRSAKSGTT